jgi:hypothetical protein
MQDLILRFLLGGTVVSFFSIAGDVLRPKSFAGLLGAAPSIALATVGLTIAQHGKSYALVELKSMILGAVAFLIYALIVSLVLRRYKPHALTATILLMPIWFAISFGLLGVFGRSL